MSDAESDGGHIEQNQRGVRPVGLLCSDGGSNLNRFFEALADDRRRRILIHLQEKGTVSLQDLARFLADQEEIDHYSEAFKRLQVDLVHLHLPKLADHGLLVFDKRTNAVSSESLPTAVEQILALAANLEETDDPSDSSEEG